MTVYIISYKVYFFNHICRFLKLNKKGAQIILDLYALFFMLHWLFAYCFYFTISTPAKWLLYHLLYHFCIDLHQFPWGYIKICFFLDIEKALRYKELLSFMSLY